MTTHSISANLSRQVQSMVALGTALIGLCGLAVGTQQVHTRAAETTNLITGQIETVIDQLSMEGKYLELPSAVSRVIGLAPPGIDFEVQVVGQPGNQALVSQSKISDPVLWTLWTTRQGYERQVPGYGYISVAIRYNILGSVLRSGAVLLSMLVMLIAAARLWLRSRIARLDTSFFSIAQIESSILFTAEETIACPTGSVNDQLGQIIHALVSERSAAASAVAKWEQAQQIAHDIRSPIAALRVVERELYTLPSETRQITRAAIDRIKAVADGLLHAQAPQAKLKAEALYPLLESIVSEKRQQYKDQSALSITTEVKDHCDNMSAQINPIDFIRIVSNLIDNSVQAFNLSKDSQQIQIELCRSEDRVLVSVIDNGDGFAAELREKLGTRGASYGKTAGNGLGLYHARSTLESWKGLLRIHSNPGAGSQVILDLPISVPAQ